VVGVGIFVVHRHHLHRVVTRVRRSRHRLVRRRKGVLSEEAIPGVLLSPEQRKLYQGSRAGGKGPE
jgi:hypothetical protein